MRQKHHTRKEVWKPFKCLRKRRRKFQQLKIPKSYSSPATVLSKKFYTWLNLLLGGVKCCAGMNFFEIVTEWSENPDHQGGYMMKENPLCASVLADVADEVFTARLRLYNLATSCPSRMTGDTAARSGLHVFTDYRFASTAESYAGDQPGNGTDGFRGLIPKNGMWKNTGAISRPIQSYLCGSRR